MNIKGTGPVTDREVLEGLYNGRFGAHEEIAHPVIYNILQSHLAGLDVSRVLEAGKQERDFVLAHRKWCLDGCKGDHARHEDFVTIDLRAEMTRLAEQMVEAGHIDSGEAKYWGLCL